MWLNGTGITTDTEIKILDKYKVETNLAIKWREGADGNWIATDRGATNDVYETTFTVHQHEVDINTMLTEIEANRAADSHILQLSNFASNEHIFGEDLDYTGTINATIVKYDKRKQKSWKGFETKLTLQALSPTFLSTASLPALQYVNRGYVGDSSVTVVKYDSYDGTFTYIDENYDAGKWKGVVLLSNANMGKMRRYLAEQRGATISIPDIAGVEYPYGPNRSAPASYPLSVKVIEWKDKGIRDLNYWHLELTLAEVI